MLTIIAIAVGAGAVVGIIAYHVTAVTIDAHAGIRALSNSELAAAMGFPRPIPARTRGRRPRQFAEDSCFDSKRDTASTVPECISSPEMIPGLHVRRFADDTASSKTLHGVVDLFCGAGSTGPRPSFVARALTNMPMEDVISGQRAFVATWTSPSDGQL